MVLSSLIDLSMFEKAVIRSFSIEGGMLPSFLLAKNDSRPIQSCEYWQRYNGNFIRNELVKNESNQ